MADDFTDQLEAWVQQIANITSNLNLKQRADITTAGAEVFRDELEKTTRQKHYSHHNDKVYGHMADHIIVSSKDTDNDLDGAATVGWNNKYHAMNAMRLNDGTRKIKADHFVTDLQEDEIIKQKVLEAEKAKYDEITGSD